MNSKATELPAENLKRVEYLDGLRGLAIIMVLLFHSFARWGEIVPYGKNLVHLYCSSMEIWVFNFFL